jgi:hypothetical protein
MPRDPRYRKRSRTAAKTVSAPRTCMAERVLPVSDPSRVTLPSWASCGSGSRPTKSAILTMALTQSFQLFPRQLEMLLLTKYCLPNYGFFKC